MIDHTEWRKLSQKVYQRKSIVFNGLRTVVDKVELFYHNTYGFFLILYMRIYRVMEITVHYFHHYWLTTYKTRS